MQFDKSPAFINFLKILIFFSLVSLFYRGIFAWYHFDKIFESENLLGLLYALIYGIRFDLTLASYLSIAFLLLQFILLRLNLLKKVLFIILFLGLSSLMVSDIMYFEESSRHLSYELKAFDVSSIGLFQTAMSQHFGIMLIHFSFITLISLGLLFKLRFPKKAKKFGVLHISNCLLILVSFIIISRGGLQMIPIKPEFVYQIGDSKLATIATNGAYSALYASMKERSLQKKELPFPKPNKPKSIAQFYKNFASAPDKGLQNRNVVVILLEGWSNSQVSRYNKQISTTPNFDRFASNNFSTELMLAEGHRTTEGIFNIFCSFPNPLGKSVAQSQLQEHPYSCLPGILKKHNWTTAFFQGSLKETSGTGSFAQSLGFSYSFGRDDIPNKEYGLNYWGKHDGDIYSFVLNKTNELPQPFFLGINTNSTHDLLLPENWKAKFPGDSKEQKIRSVVHYADAMLGKFIDNFLRNYPDSIIVLAADHSSHIHGGLLQQFSIPFAILGRDVPKELKKTISSHRDIAPTVAGYLGIDKSQYAHFTGIDLFHNDQSFASLYHNGVFGFAYKDKIFTYPFANGDYKPSSSLILFTETASLDKDNKWEEFYLNFVYQSQKLLFEGKTKDFHYLKNDLKCCTEPGNNGSGK